MCPVKKFQALDDYQAEQRVQDEEKHFEEEEEQGDMDNTQQGTTKKKKKQECVLNEDELQEVFRRTSAFSAASTVVTPTTGEAIMIPGDVSNKPEVYYFDDGWDMTGVIQDEDATGQAVYNCGSDLENEDEDGLWEEMTCGDEFGGGKRARSGRFSSRQSPDSHAASALARARQGLKRAKKRKAVDPNAISFVRIPSNPIPSSWAKRILQYIPPECTNISHAWTSEAILIPQPVSFQVDPPSSSNLVRCPRLVECEDTLLALAKTCEGFHGVVLNPPWTEPRPGCHAHAHGGIVPEDLNKLPLGNYKFLPCGFVFIWTPKHWLHRTLVALEKMDLHYVENAVVVNEHVGGAAPFSQTSTYFAQQKDTLLVCRRGKRDPSGRGVNWEPIEMRHQRISDVHQACFQTESENSDVPQKPRGYVHKMVETMLPLARYNIDQPNEKCRLCELWSKDGVARSGWVSVVEC